MTIRFDLLERINDSGGEGMIVHPTSVALFQSASRPEELHICIVLPVGPVCSCEGYLYRAECKHSKAMQPATS